MKISNVVELLLLASLWGGSFLFMRVAAPVLGPVWLIEFRVLLAGLTLLPLLIRLDLLREVRRHWLPLLVVGALNTALPFVLFAFATVSLPAGFTAILNATVPLFGTVVALVWLHEKPTLLGAIGFALGFTGVVILVGWEAIHATPAFLTAVVAGLSAALMYSIAAPYIKKTLAGVPSLVIASGSQLSAACLLVPVLPFTVPLAKPTTGVVAAVIALALLSTAVAYVLYFRLIENIGPTRTLTVAYLIPLFAMLWGAIALGEAITIPMILGCGLVLLGTAIANGLLTPEALKSFGEPKI